MIHVPAFPFLRFFAPVAALLASMVCPLPTSGAPIHSSAVFPQETILSTAQPYVISMILADLDGDGLKDIVAASQNPKKIVWYKNNGNGTFSGELIISLGLSAPSCIFAAYIDGDSRLDIAASLGPSNRVVWFKNVGGPLANGLFDYQSGTNARPVSAIVNSGEEVLSVTVANIDGAGQADIIATSFGPTPGNPFGPYVSKISWYKNLGEGDFGWNPLLPYANQNVISNAGLSPTSIATADLNGDGYLDLIVTSENDNTVAWFQGSAPVNQIPQFTRRVIASNQMRTSAAAVGDIDGDGYLDVVCSAPFGNTVTWFRNATHDFGSVAPYFGAGNQITGFAEGAYGVAIADLNNDGYRDVLSASFSDNKVSWYQNFGAGSFGWNASVPEANQKIVASPVSGAYTVAALDFNQDGKMDVVSGAQNTGKIAAYLNQGGQVALSSADSAAATIMNGAKDDVLTVAVSNRGVAGDNNAQLFSLSLLFEKSAGVVLSAGEANALIDNLQIFVDANSSGAFEPGVDTLVGTAADLPLSAGRLVVGLTPANAADAQISPASTRQFFVVAQMTAEASLLSAKTFRVTHISQGAGSTVTKDATSGAVLTLEYAANPDAPSTFATATPNVIQTWRQGWFSTISNSGAAANTANPDGDAFVNLAEFAFGTNPLANSPGAITVNAGAITPGAPTTLVTNTGTGVEFRALYGRLTNYALAGLGYSVEFSADLASWTPSADVPTIVADNGLLQAVTVPYPFFINGKKARFFRIVITGP